MLTILHVASGDLWGGAETMLWYLAREQRQSCCVNAKVLLLNDGLLADRLRDVDVPVIVVPENRCGSLRLMALIKTAVREAVPDVVHTHGRKANVLGAIAAWAIRAPSMRTVHGSEEHPPQWWNLRRIVAHWADLLIADSLQSRTVAVSADLAKSLTAAGFRRVQVVLNGIDASWVLAQASRIDGPGRTSGQVTIGFVGRLTPIKRVDRFLALARELQQRMPNVFRFVVIGDGPQKGEAMKIVEELELKDDVTFKGTVENVLPALAELDAVVMTSDNEGIPYVVLECLVLGVPVLAFRVGGLPEALDHGLAGRLADAGDLEALIGHTLAFGESPSSFDRQVQTGARLVQERFSSREMMRDYLAIYQDIVTVDARGKV